MDVAEAGGRGTRSPSRGFQLRSGNGGGNRNQGTAEDTRRCALESGQDWFASRMQAAAWSTKKELFVVSGGLISRALAVVVPNAMS